MIAAVFGAVHLAFELYGLLGGEQIPASVACDHPLLEAFLRTAVPVDHPVVVLPYPHGLGLRWDEMSGTCMAYPLRGAVLAVFGRLLLPEDRFDRLGEGGAAACALVRKGHGWLLSEP